jgi:hypothetical protein
MAAFFCSLSDTRTLLRDPGWITELVFSGLELIEPIVSSFVFELEFCKCAESLVDALLWEMGTFTKYSFNSIDGLSEFILDLQVRSI